MKWGKIYLKLLKTFFLAFFLLLDFYVLKIDDLEMFSCEERKRERGWGKGDKSHVIVIVCHDDDDAFECTKVCPLKEIQFKFVQSQ